MRLGAGHGAVAATVLIVVLIALGAMAARALRDAPRRDGGAMLPAAGAGSTAVMLSRDAVADPAAAPVRSTLQRYFDAINTRDYAAWAQVVGPQRRAAQPEPTWLEDYRSTSDGTIRVDRIDRRDDGTLLVRVQFVSLQDVDHAPQDAPYPRLCWRTTLPIAGAQPRVVQTRGNASAHRPC